MSIGWYNGTSPANRLAVIPVQHAAILAGAIPKPTKCSICGSSENDHSGQNRFGLHSENYNEPLHAYPICGRCHGHLHRRFYRPRPWLRLVSRYGDGGRWFEALSMDVACLTVPFAETYPNDLPLT